ncbi:MAG TPA: hypothetical protein VKB34_19260 [Povalibacter sp.]|nr:hypothetical protein [Povalibacter sp.]
MAIGTEASADTPALALPATRPTIVARVRQALASAALLRAAREILIVTIGILIAFALNAWWERHKELRDEQAHLRALASDFEQNAARLKELADFLETVVAGNQQVLELARSSHEIPPDVVRPLIGRVFSSRRFEPVMGAYEALVNSAGLTLVRDDQLRAALADFASGVTTRYSERFSDELYLAFIRRFMGRLQFPEFMNPAGHPSYDTLLADPEFQDYLAIRSQAEQEVAGIYRGLQHQAEDILVRLRRDIH